MCISRSSPGPSHMSKRDSSIHPVHYWEMTLIARKEQSIQSEKPNICADNKTSVTHAYYAMSGTTSLHVLSTSALAACAYIRFVRGSTSLRDGLCHWGSAQIRSPHDLRKETRSSHLSNIAMQCDGSGKWPPFPRHLVVSAC